MKYAVSLFAVLVLLVSTVSAVDMIITPQMVTMGYTDAQDVEVCAFRASGAPYENLDIVIGAVCQDLNGDEACSAADGDATGLFSASVIASPTDAEGCGMIRLETTDAMGGIFVYQVNGYNADVFVHGEGGLAYIPEFGILASAAVLGLAGLYIYKKRN